jgi:serine acetyltransferase
MKFRPETLWWWSCLAYRRRLFRLAKLLKGINFFVFHAVLPFEAEIHPEIYLEHFALGIVIHPNVTLGQGVRIYQHVTLSATTWIGSEHRVVIGKNVMIGAGAVVITKENQSLHIGDGAKIGANAVVTHDVLPGQTVVGVPARPVVPKTHPPA